MPAKSELHTNAFSYSYLEAAIGFEPMNKGFADLRLKPLGHAAEKLFVNTF